MSENRPRVLVVDDDSLSRRILTQVLASAGYEVESAVDGQDALGKIRSHRPDVVVTDWQMPRMDGLTALKHIMIRNARPVVVLSAFTPQTSPLSYQSFKLGAVDVLTKPSQKADISLKMEQEELCRHIREAGAVRLRSPP